MKFGRRFDDKSYQTETSVIFALLPVQLDDGRHAWLERVELYWHEDEHSNWAGDDSGYRYREIPRWPCEHAARGLALCPRQCGPCSAPLVDEIKSHFLCGGERG